MKALAGLAFLAAIGAQAQAASDSTAITFTGSVVTLTGSSASNAVSEDGESSTRSVTYLSGNSTRTVSTTTTASSASNGTASDSESVSTGTSSSVTLTIINGGSGSTTTPSGTITSSSARPMNTQPCNSYPEFCTRKYSNITEVCAHNSPFVRNNNVFSNQMLGVTDQLDDGVRMLQGQTHYENDTLWFCHTSCSFLNSGTVENYLTTVNDWVSQHPFDIVTILLGNGDNVDVTKFVEPIQKSGLAKWLYEPPKVPMGLNDWPILGQMILAQKRVVLFLDYGANQTQVPYILDEFSQLWETPFSPTNFTSCSPQRPPKLSNSQARNRMYMANHNLNLPVSFSGDDILIPARSALNRTNNVTGNGSLGSTANMCADEWNRPPNFLLVDYYNVPNGTVFEVAARMNNVTYNRTCCGNNRSAAMQLRRSPSAFAICAAIVAVWWIGF